MKAGFMQRMLAYFIDVIIISVIFSVFSVFIPNNNDKIAELNQKLNNAENSMVESLQSGDNNSYKQSLDEVIDIQYEMSRVSVLRDSILFVITFVYFVILQFVLKGKTFGKMIMSIKVIDKKKKEPGLGTILLRTFIVQGLLSSFIAIVTILFMDKKVYTLFNGGISLLTSIFIIVCALMILYRKDKCGLHDMMAGTSVIKYEK